MVYVHMGNSPGRRYMCKLSVFTSVTIKVMLIPRQTYYTYPTN